MGTPAHLREQWEIGPAAEFRPSGNVALNFFEMEVDADAAKPFISLEAFQTLSYAHFSIFSNLEESVAYSFPEQDDSDKCSDVTALEVQCLDENEHSCADDKQTDTEVQDPFFSRFSSVSSDEQKSYFILKKMLMRGKEALGEIKQKEYEHLNSKVVMEQTMYLKLLETFCKKNPLPYNLNVEIEKYVQELVMFRWEEPLEYSRYYAAKSLVPFISTVKVHAAFEHLFSVIQLGQVHHLTLPSMKGSRFLTRNYSKLSFRYPPKDAADNWLRMPVSKDPNARILAARYGADVVMSFGSLQTIFTNHERCLENSWEMPVIVEADASGAEKDKQLKKIVFIDKGFLKINLTVFEKNLMYHRLALKEALLSPKHKSSVDFSNLDQATIFTYNKKETTKTLTVSMNPAQDLPNMQNAEENCRSTIEDELAQSSDSEIGLFIDERPDSPDPDRNASDIGATSHKSCADLNTCTESRPAVRRSSRLKERSSLKEEILKQNSPKQQKNVPIVKTPEPDDPCNYVQPPAGWNVCYQLWRIGNLKVLVRCSVAGVSKFSRKNRFWQLAPKLEYQPIHGAQALTFTEYVHQWISAAIVPCISLARVRINAFNSEIIGLEELDLHHVIPPQYLVQIGECISSTSTILSKLTSLPTGNYLISHAPNEDSLKILREVSESESFKVSNLYDLHLKYLAADAFSLDDDNSESVPWLPIDPDVLLFRHKNACCIPALFRDKGTYIRPQKKKKKKIAKRKTTKS